MTAEIIVLSDVRAARRKRVVSGPADVTGEMVRLGDAWTALTLHTLATAARIATTPMWPWP